MTRQVLITGGSGFIGTNLISHLVANGYGVTNFDIKAPPLPEQASLWRRGDILELHEVETVLSAIQPEIVVHLAARTDTEGQSLDDYVVNTGGTDNLLAAVRRSQAVKRLVVASTQFVVGPGSLPRSDIDYRPHTVYGKSKAIMEESVRRAELPVVWTIVRPTNVWGPWHPRYPQQFWKVLAQGRYVHPGSTPVFRSYCYVGNLVWKMQRLIEADDALVHGRVFYLSDPTGDIREWANSFSIALTGRAVRTMPRFLVRGLALLGDIVIWGGGRFPIYSSRFKSMTTDYLTPLEASRSVLGSGPYSLGEGVTETVMWLRSQEKSGRRWWAS